MRHEFVFDDGGMNLLSTRALRSIRTEVDRVREVAGSSLLVRGDASPDFDSARPDQPIFVFRSGRPNIFAAGADMAEMERFSAWDAYEFARLGQETFDAIERLPCLTVALIDGDCFGGALDLVLAFDLRFATPRSRFSHPGARLGIVTGFGGTTRWQSVLSRRSANQLFLANRVFSAEAALAMGLVDRVGDEHGDALARLERTDLRMLKEVSVHSERLSRSELVLMAQRLAAIYCG
jgi:enoyl-CoA hydratase